MEEGALGVDTRDYGVGGNFFAVGEDQSGYGTIFDADVADVGIGANFGTSFAGGSG